MGASVNASSGSRWNNSLLGHPTQSKATLNQDIEVEVQFLLLLRLELSSTKSSVAKMEQEKTRAFEKSNLERALMHKINTHSCIIIITAAASQIALSTAHRHHHGRNMHHQHSSNITEQQLGAPCLLVLHSLGYGAWLHLLQHVVPDHAAHTSTGLVGVPLTSTGSSSNLVPTAAALHC